MLINEIKKEIFLEAYKNISDPEQWCSGSFALDHDGYTVTIDDKNACKWCAAGHFYKAALKDPAWMRYTTELIDEISGYYQILLTDLNDCNSHSNVLMYLNRYGLYKGWLEEIVVN